MSNIRKAGEVWTITHSRKGTMTIRLHHDVDESMEFFDADLLEGKPSYASNEVRIGFLGLQPPIAGVDAMSFRQSLVRWDEKQ